MDRRAFLKAAGSFALLLPWAGQKAFAQSPPYSGPFLVCIHASGAWDTTLFFDPKPPPTSRAYSQPDSLGAFSFAPVRFLTNSNDENSVELHSPEAFLNRYQNRLLVLNGINTETNAHPVGQQIVWSGRSTAEYPSIGALLAAKASQTLDLPCAYLADSGSYTKTLGLVPLSRVNASGMRTIAYENRFPGNTTSELFSEKTSQRIREAQEKRIQHLATQLAMPESKEALGRYNKAMLAKSGLVSWVESLPSPSINLEALRPGAGGAINGLLQQAELALYGFLSGNVVSASLSLGGFDSHSNNDNTQRTLLGYLFVLVEYVLEKAAELGLSNLYVAVGSDFARTPTYNAGDGKDDWSIGSYMLFGPEIRGGRVLGASTENQHADYVNPQDPAQRLPKNAGGIVLKPSHVHLELRRVLGLSAFSAAYGLAEAPVRLF